MSIEKFNSNINMMVVDEAFNRLINVVDLANKNIALTNSLLAGLDERYKKQNSESLWENNNTISETKKCWNEATENWRELITNLEEHFNYSHKQGYVKYDPESLLSNVDGIDYDLKRVISMCSDDDLSKYIKRIKEVQTENNKQMQNELNQNNEDNLESYWTPENYRTFCKSLDDIINNVSFCCNNIKYFFDDNKEIKTNNISENENINDKMTKIVQEISQLEQERMTIDNKINEKINELNSIITYNNQIEDKSEQKMDDSKDSEMIDEKN